MDPDGGARPVAMVLTLRQAGAVVPVQSVARSTEAVVGPIWTFSAEVFTSSVPGATAVGGGAHCVMTKTRRRLQHRSEQTSEKCSRDGLTSVTVDSMKTRRTFADVGVKVASTGGAVLTGRRQAAIHGCKQEVTSSVAMRNPGWGEWSTVYLCRSSRSSPENREDIS